MRFFPAAATAIALFALGAPAFAQAPEAVPPKSEQIEAKPDAVQPRADQSTIEKPAEPEQLETLPERHTDFKTRVEGETNVLGLGALMGQHVEVGDRTGSVAAMAEEINIPGHVGGDVFAAGRAITIGGQVDGDLRAMGERVTLTGSVHGETSLAAQDIEVSGPVEGPLHAAGQTVLINEGARIGGAARLAGQEVNARGHFSEDVHAAGDSVLVDAAIDGDLTVRARHITIGPNANITGRLNWRAAEAPEIDPAARIGGGSEGAVGNWRERRFEASPRQMYALGWFARIGFSIMWALTAFLIGLVLALAAPAYFDRATSALRTRPLPALGWGLLMFFAPIALAIVLMATLIGIPLGLIALFAYPLFLAAGYALGAAGFGALLVRARTGAGRLGALALGVAIIGALAFVPWLGGAIAFIAMWLGLGLLVVALHRDAPPPAAAPSAPAATA